MTGRARAHLASLSARLQQRAPLTPQAADKLAEIALEHQADLAILARQEKQRRTLREVELRDQFVQLLRDIVEHTEQGREHHVRACISEGKFLLGELDDLHAQAGLVVRELA